MLSLLSDENFNGDIVRGLLLRRSDRVHFNVPISGRG
jgi:hypothetical protein